MVSSRDWPRSGHGVSVAGRLHGLLNVAKGVTVSGLVPPAWRTAVFGRTDGVEVSRDAWVLCVLEQLRASLRRRDVFAVGSARWSDPRARLLDGEAWEAAHERALRSLSLDGPVEEHLRARAGTLHAAWRGLSDAIEATGADSSVRVVEGTDGRTWLEVAPLDALEVPASLTRLRDRVAAMLPQVDLSELLLEVHSWTGFLGAYTHIGEIGSRMDDLPLSVAAVLISEACNVGLTPVVSEGHPALTRDRLGHVDANSVRAETHAAACGPR